MSFSSVKVLTAIVSMLLLCCIAWGQESDVPLPTVDDAYLARDDGAGKAGERSLSFRTTDIPVHCVVILNNEHAQQVKINFIAVRVPGVKPETKVVSASYDTKPGQTSVNFIGRPEGRWMSGSYRVDVFVEGKMLRTLDMRVEASTDAVQYLLPKFDRKVPRRLSKPVKNRAAMSPVLNSKS